MTELKKKKFIKWCSVFPYLIGNPLYLWSLFELKEIFGITYIPDKNNSEKLYDELNDFLSKNEVTVEYLLKAFNVELICPCISVVDSFEYFSEMDKVKPSMRGDDIVSPTKDFITLLENKTGSKIKTLEEYKAVILGELTKLRNIGCKFSDHALDNGFEFYKDDGKSDERFNAAINGSIDSEDKKKLLSHLMLFLGECYAKLGFALQLHIGAQRSTSDRLKEIAGAQGGFAAIGNSVKITSVTDYFNALEKTKYGIPKTILFTLNPADNAMISVLSGSFSKDGASGLITQGPAWWWCDHKKGITDMLENNAAFGSICNFIGMTTDSRSFLSLSRHDYFRRILCDWYAGKCDSNEFLNSDEINKEILTKLCYKNAEMAVWEE